MKHAILLDTCAAIWLMEGEPISKESQKALQVALRNNFGVYVSPFTASEIGTLLAKGKLQLPIAPEIWFEMLLQKPGIRLADLSPKILLASSSLPGTIHGDPADRILAATARIEGWTLMTRDAKLLDYANTGHLRAVRC